MASRAAVDRKSVEREVKVVSAIRKKSFSVKIMKGSVIYIRDQESKTILRKGIVKSAIYKNFRGDRVKRKGTIFLSLFFTTV